MPRPKSDIKERIIAAAKKLFLDQGVDGTSLRQIAAAAGTNIGMVYYYFPSKDEIFFGLVEEIYARLLADLETRLSLQNEGGVGSVGDRLAHLFLRLGEVTEQEVDVIQLVLREAFSSNERRCRLVERFMKGHIPLVMGHLMQGQSAGQLDPRIHPVVLLMATLALAGPPQIVRKRIGGLVPMALAPSGAALSKQLLDVLMHGISKKA